MPKGKKVCEKCNAELGVRTLVCPNCNHAFFSGVKAEPSAPMEATRTAPAKPVVLTGQIVAHPGERSEQLAVPVPPIEPKETIEPKEVAGPGRKQCPTCKKFIGIRTRTCACGHSFKKDEPETLVFIGSMELEARKWAGAYGWTGDRVLVPAGKCPVSLREFTREAVEAWVDELVNLTYERNTLGMFSPNALRYYLGDLCDGDDRKVAFEHLNAIVNEKIAGIRIEAEDDSIAN